MSLQMEPGLDALLRTLAARAATIGAKIALAGARARIVWGSNEVASTIDIIATTMPPSVNGFVQAEVDAGYVHLLPQLRWSVRGDEFRELYRAAIERAVTLPNMALPIVPMDLLGAMLLADKTAAARTLLIANIVAGHMQTEPLRQIVLEHLGPYAVSDLESVVADAEWHAMTMKYEAGEEVH